MDFRDVLLDLFGRVDEHVADVLEGLDEATLNRPPAPNANHIGWLVWHLTRVQDSHIAELIEADELWTTGPWAPRIGLAPDPDNTGYGHTPEEVAAVHPDGPDVLAEYYAAVAERTRSYLAALAEADLGRIVDERWDPPVTLAVRLISVADDDIQHAGQAAYVKGLLGR
jgi:uncharacterized damage-inducible protein DinB